MNKKIVAILVGIVILIAIWFSYKRMTEPETGTGSYLEDSKRRSGPCPGVSQIVESEGKKLKLIPNWYECNPLKAGDLVWSRFSFTKDPVARRLISVPGNTFSLEKDSEQEGWKLLVNDKIVLNSEKKPYVFGKGQHEPPLTLYTKKGIGTLKPREAILFADPSAGYLDSGMFGVVNADDFLGKLESADPQAQ